jgi:hypothetical protein
MSWQDVTISPNAAARAAVDRHVIDRDRRFFAKNRRRKFRGRYASELEAIGYRNGLAADGRPLPEGGITIVIVQNVKPGMRLRHFHHVPCGDQAIDIRFPNDDTELERIAAGFAAVMPAGDEWVLCVWPA